MTLFKDSIHFESMSPSNTIHFGFWSTRLLNSRMYFESKPSFQSLVNVFIDPNSSSLVTALGSMSIIVTRLSIFFEKVSARAFQTFVFP